MAKTPKPTDKKAAAKNRRKAPNPRKAPAKDRAVERHQESPVDDFGEWLISQRGSVNPDLDLEF